MRFPNGSTDRVDMMYPADFSYWEKLKAFVDYEPVSAFTPEESGILASIGIIKGVPFNPDATAKAMDYTLNRWAALAIYLDDARIPIDNNAVENAIRPLALGRKNWLFVGSQQAGERAAVLMSLIESAKLNGHDAWVYLKDILDKLPTWPNSRLQELLPHRWQPPQSARG